MQSHLFIGCNQNGVNVPVADDVEALQLADGATSRRCRADKRRHNAPDVPSPMRRHQRGAGPAVDESRLARTALVGCTWELSAAYQHQLHP